MLQQRNNNEVKARTRELSQGLLRQRRNLIISSIIMPLFFVGEMSVEKINVFGSVLDVKNQFGIKSIIILFFSYSLLRFWQYYREEIHTKEIWGAFVQSIIEKEEKYLEIEARNKAKMVTVSKSRIHVSFPTKKSDSIPQQPLINRRIEEKVPLFKRSASVEIQICDPAYEQKFLGEKYNIQNPNEDEIESLSKQWKLIGKAVDDSRSGVLFSSQLEYSIPRIYLLRTYGGISFFLNQSYVTDYQLPFVIAVISAAVTLYFTIFQ